MFKLDPAAEGTSVRGCALFECPPVLMVHVFGAPLEADGIKVSGEFRFSGENGEVFTVYEWKQTDLYGGKGCGCPTSEEFWGSASLATMHVGGHSDPSRFISWLDGALVAYLDAHDCEIRESPAAAQRRSRLADPGRQRRFRLTHKLHDACLAGDVERVEELVLGGADINHRSHAEAGRRVPLEDAIDSGSQAVLESLIKHGAEVNPKDRSCGTPLKHAVVLNRKSMVHLLLNSGADVNARDYYGTPLDWANRLEHGSMARLLVEHNAVAARRTESEDRPNVETTIAAP